MAGVKGSTVFNMLINKVRLKMLDDDDDDDDDLCVCVCVCVCVYVCACVCVCVVFNMLNMQKQ